MAEEKEQNEAMNQDAESQENQKANEQPSEETVSTDNTSVEPAAEDQIAALNDKYIRLYSEFDNYRKRTNKEKLELIATASSGVLKDMLTVLDDFERAIANNEGADDIEAVKEGFKLIHHKFKMILEGKGLKQMEAKGLSFDPELHEAIANIPAPSEDLKGKIIEDVERGYFLNERVIRYAKVVVGN
jgi:molecular chaperone GrpE